jgi:ABC-type polysaccharide/polyol phosphate transport system ATPase subunit
VKGNMNNDIAIKVEGLSKRYKLYDKNKDRLLEALSPVRKKRHTDFYSVKNVDLEVKKGEIVGVIGRNGSGKSTLMKLIAGVITPTKGTVKTNGTIVPLLELGSGFHPDFTGLENIYFYTTILGYPKSLVREKAKEIIEFADIGEFLNQPYRTYSSGMKSRLAFSVSVNIDPDILILDEILSVGDSVFKKKSHEKIKSFFESGKTILFVSHSMESIIELCNRAIIIDKGEKILDGPPDKVVEAYETLMRTKKDRFKVRNQIKNMKLS